MKKLSALLLLFSALAIIVLYKGQSTDKKNPTGTSANPSLNPALQTDTSISPQRQSLIVPYWAVTTQIKSDNYDSLIYFGIAANKDGIDTIDAGYKKMRQFMLVSDNTKERLLVIRMIDSKINSAVLEDKNAQKKIIDEAVSMAQQQGFDGVVLDFEISALSFDSVINNISSFEKDFYQSAKNNHLQFDVMLYGDTFFRYRPYDVELIAKNSDQILVMAYDFHKAREDPGANFPLNGKDQYGYDVTVMTKDFLQSVPKSKLTIVFGLFGYDWTVDEKEKSTKTAEALSYLMIKKQFLDSCGFTRCDIKRDVVSGETEIKYTDKDNQPHLVWFEDMDSVAQKEAYLKKQGINSYSFWAYSYF